ncbi:ABC transporter permease [Rhodoplanes sp. SY1]|uniref:ABC transporter permease n=1 Tax=Rhodoplanes sp. SY1 TaxID=3166646 RepID=UPI0038B4B56C
MQISADRKNSLFFDRAWLGHSLHFLQRDIARQYDRTAIGIAWLLLSQIITISGIAIVFSTVFRTELKDFFPHLAISLLCWNLISGAIAESPRVYHAAGPILNAFPVPYPTFAFRMVVRYFVSFMFGLPIFLAVAFWFGVPFFPTVLLSLVNFPLLALLLYPLANFLGIAGARFRDLAPTVGSVIYLLFLVSPILYKPNAIPQHASLLLYLNPFYYLLEVARAPFLGQVPSLAVYAGTIGMTIIAWILSTVANRKYGRYVVFWV